MIKTIELFGRVRARILDAADERRAAEEICLCAVCRKMLYAADELAERRHYSLGELDSIELAHRGCARTDNLDRGTIWWDYDPPGAREH